MQPVRPPLVSQNGEDFLLLTAFEHQSRGFFIDVGAFDGIHLSNTWALEQMGWFGYCLEPAPETFARLTVNRPGSICLPVAAGAEPGRAKLVIDPTMLLSSMAAEGREVRRVHELTTRHHALEDWDFRTHMVEVVPLDDLLRKHAPSPRIDVVTIDVEGAEPDVLDGFDLAYHRPRVLVIDADDPSIGDALVSRCEHAGFEAVRHLGNRHFFAFEDHLKEQLATTRVDCYFPANLHPSGVDYTHPHLRNDRIVLDGVSHTWDEVQSSADRDRIDPSPPAKASATSKPTTMGSC